MNEDFLHWNRIGFVPGPKENEEQYRKRVEYCLNLEEEVANKLPFGADDRASKAVLPVSFATTKKIYDIAPDWIPVFFSDYKLALWHGGSAWIFQADEKSPTAAVLQLKQKFRKSESYLGYTREELVAHELVHVGRMVFEEPIFEEFHAYRSSDSRFRRYFGPIIRSPWESILFVMLLLFIFILDVSLIALKRHDAYDWVMWIKGVPVLLIIAALGRLAWRHRQYDRCLEVLKKMTRHPQAMIYRLTDREIVDFGKMDETGIKKYADNGSLRWKVVVEAYF